MTSQTLFLGTCFACVAALGGFERGTPTPAMPAPVAAATVAPVRVAQPDRDALRRKAAADLDIARVSAEGSLQRAQERCEAQGNAAGDDCRSRARDLYEESIAAAAEDYAAAGRQIAALTN